MITIQNYESEKGTNKNKNKSNCTRKTNIQYITDNYHNQIKEHKILSFMTQLTFNINLAIIPPNKKA